MSSTYSFLFVLALSFSLLFNCQAYASATCHQPNGDVDSSVVPCNSTINSSACCDPLDSCSTSGLCLGSSGFVYRSACTDPTWSSPNCPQICLRDPLTNGLADNHLDIYHCTVGAYTTISSCGSGSRNNTCAYNFTFPGTGYAFKPGTDALLAELASYAAAANASQATTTAPSNTKITASASTSSPSSSRPNSPSANLGLAIGVGVGVPLGILALGLLAFLVWKETKKATDTNRDRPVEYYDSASKSWKSGDGEWIQTPMDNQGRVAMRRPQYPGPEELGGTARIPPVEMGN